MKNRTLNLRHSLDNDYALALELTSALGYGGLIHHFKSFLLRPDQLQYFEAGMAAAALADELVLSLEEDAGELGIEATLTDTRAMISGYRERIERIPMLVSAGMSLEQMDEALRLDDQFALQEIGNLLDQLSVSVEEQIDEIAVQGRMLQLLDLAVTTALSVLIMMMFLQHRIKAAHLKSIDTLNRKLAASNASLTEANTSLQQFAGIVSHDLKTPLRHISLANEQTLQQIDDREAVRSCVATVKASVARMSNMIGGLLDFSSTGFKTPCREMIDIKPLITDVVAEFQTTIEEKRARVMVQAEGRVLADALLLRRVLQILLDNSLKYVKPGQAPRISIVAKCVRGSGSDNMQIMVNDNGTGIPSAQADRVFEPLQALHVNRQQNARAGFGLSLAKTIVTAHGGYIGIADDHGGQGTRVYVNLPGESVQSGPLPPANTRRVPAASGTH